MRIITVGMAVLALANLVLFGLRKIDELWFWGTMAVLALYAYYVLPKIKKE